MRKFFVWKVESLKWKVERLTKKSAPKDTFLEDLKNFQIFKFSNLQIAEGVSPRTLPILNGTGT